MARRKQRTTKKADNSVLTIVLVVAAVFLFSGGNLGGLLTGNVAQRGSQAVLCQWEGMSILDGKATMQYVPGGVVIANCVNGDLQLDFCENAPLAIGGNKAGVSRNLLV